MLRPMSSGSARDRVLAAVEASADEIVAFTSELIRIPTDQSAWRGLPGMRALHWRRSSRRVASTSSTSTADGRPEHTDDPSARQRGRATRRGRRRDPAVHLNGHFDVVPAGGGWTVDPFGGVVRDGRIYGRGSCDMKAGIAAAVFAAEAIRRAGVQLAGSIEISGTVDEESGGFAGVAWLAERGVLDARATHRLRHHSRAAERRSRLHRPSRRVLVRGGHPRPHRPRQHAVSRRQRHRSHGPRCSIAFSSELLPDSAGRTTERARRAAEARATPR